MNYAKNKKAYHDYQILEEYEAGIVLNGDEVKSVKTNQANLKGAFIAINNGEAFINGMHIGHYKKSSTKDHDPTRQRKILLSKKEILKIESQLDSSGITAIPLELYPKKNLIKLKVGVCRGKKLYDKRQDLRKKDQKIEIARQLKNY